MCGANAKKIILMFFATGFVFPSLIHDIDELVMIWIDFFHVSFCICVNILWRLFSKSFSGDSRCDVYNVYTSVANMSVGTLCRYFIFPVFCSHSDYFISSSAFLDFFFAMNSKLAETSLLHIHKNQLGLFFTGFQCD